MSAMDSTLPTPSATVKVPVFPPLALNAARLVLVAAAFGLGANVLFVGDELGLNLPLFGLSLLVALFGVAALEGIRPRWRNAWLALPIALLLVMVAVRDEPFVIVLNTLTALCLSVVLFRTFRQGDVVQMGILDYASTFFWTGLDSAMVYPPAALHQASRHTGGSLSSRLWAVGRGALIALPIVLVLTALLASADPAFQQAVVDALIALNLDSIPELIWHLLVITGGAWLVLGALAQALGREAEGAQATPRPALPRFIGATETTVVLASVNALFASFVVIQFQYFFGGDQTLEVAGLTYADYARRGFFELVVVAMLTLSLALTLRAVTRLSSARANQLFNGLCLLLVTLTGVLLVSAFQRLWLYEDAYGFTCLRTYAHGFIIWLGVALLVFLVTTLAQRPHLFLFGALACGLGFVITLNVFSTDAFITRENIARGTLLTSSTIETLTGRYEARSVDTAYLATLSADAVPDLVAALEHPDPEIRAAVRAVVDARIAAFDPDSFGPDRWPSWNYARLRAAELLAAAQGVVP